MQIKIPNILARDSDSFVLRESAFTHSTFLSVLLINARREYSTSSAEVTSISNLGNQSKTSDLPIACCPKTTSSI
jgi:hypothetical protein